MSIIINNWRMDPSLNALIHCETGEMRRLGEYHFILLETLAKNAETVLSRSYLCAEVWKNRIVGGNSLPTAIHALRVAIDDDGKQQNIIKTIPKKGYLCNKEYISLPASASAETLNIAVEPQEVVSPVRDEETLPATPLLPARKKRNYVLGLTMLTVAIAVGSTVGYSYDKNMPDTPQLIKETVNSPRIKIFHLSTDGGTNTAPLLSQTLTPGKEKLDNLLSAHNMTMTTYYKYVRDRLESDIVLRNQCNGSWQLTFNVESWQNSDISSAMYQNLEKLLNTVQKC
ncbi:transcriptional regulator [Escherichia marmotae]|uniref:winged helix-turn-helix domain-containing protein n=1 Tax=Escherichia TaxID=561 RepID=UPI000F0B3C04|nr:MULTISPECIES: winged helix-turn-helix domain-containing protein [Escherichia]MBB2402550.1 winged helix-turn-helix domain-containing protein [Escherichia sp. 14.0993]MEC9532616.1 winged helix-turn-helix domain-containing protein [Escherichia marmotae]MEC9849359.1 winged helix-turn-helix domain-containing protein [Escherichia marmotae]MEC9927485.1 winged helix-turn-helix domain-containing protein [Escherichia marmotae]MEC9978948.1 winged helix-turn-helix domain-containing protein [Escherichia